LLPGKQWQMVLMSIAKAYKEMLAIRELSQDAAQQIIVDSLDKLQRQLGRQRLRRWWHFWDRAPAVPIAGRYIWGGVGRGKTFLMDLFFATLPGKRKKRIHFHRMMSDIHARLKLLKDVEDPLERVAADIAAETDILCFDEFFVSDIADAMILGRLLDGLFRRNVVLVTTSNISPADLYSNGLQRDRFLQAIELLETHTLVMQLDGDEDYRLRLLRQAGTYLTPAGDAAEQKLAHFFSDIAPDTVIEGQELEVNGRNIPTRRCAKGLAWFEFTDLCDGPRSQQDYIELARCYQTVIISYVPVLGSNSEDAARRFIALVDEFYDRKVKLLLSADAPIDSLYQGKRLAFEFQRTHSRLTEMQTSEYLHTAHLA
jgi:cell division protein ZapE